MTKRFPFTLTYRLLQQFFFLSLSVLFLPVRYLCALAKNGTAHPHKVPAKDQFLDLLPSQQECRLLLLNGENDTAPVRL